MADIKETPEKETPERDEATSEVSNFIWTIVDEELAPGGRVEGQKIVTRFPPEPNGYLHIGHAKAICIDFGTALKYGGDCHLRMDDTNPAKEDEEYVDAIQEDIHWLGFDWGDHFYYASDYFEKMYECALELIDKGLAFVCELTGNEIRETRGTLTSPGTNSPYRNRPIEENRDLFRRMRAGEFPDGAYTLRAKIDMSSGNMNMRDPVIYRISHKHHHRQGDAWPIYPMYDFAHPIEDAIEGITHSLCSLEFEDHRPLYNWVRDNCTLPSSPRQIEFARLNLKGTVMSKRLLRALVEAGVVDGWDDPRMPTLCGLRRRGVTPQAIRNFCGAIGVAKVNSTVDSALLDHFISEDLNTEALRGMAVLRPLKLVLNNYPEDKEEDLTVANHPQRPELGSHLTKFTKTLWIDAGDFAIEPPPKYHRLYVGAKVRLREAYIIECTGYDTDENGEVTCVYCDYDPETQGGVAREGEKVRGTIQWVSAKYGKSCFLRHFSDLFTEAIPGDGIPDIPEVLVGPEEDGMDVMARIDILRNKLAESQEEAGQSFEEEEEVLAASFTQRVDGAGAPGAPAGASGSDTSDSDASSARVDNSFAQFGDLQYNPASLSMNRKAVLEPFIVEQAKAQPETHFQFMREAYYILDQPLSKNFMAGKEDAIPVFNRTIGLKDTYAAKKRSGKGGKGGQAR